jgi:hypothetical protein
LNAGHEIDKRRANVVAILESAHNQRRERLREEQAAQARGAREFGLNVAAEPVCVLRRGGLAPG